MFYEALASLLGKAGDAIQAGLDDGPGDARSRRQMRQIALLLRRTHAIWPALFGTLIQDTQILRRGLDQSNEILSSHGLDTSQVEHDGDPLALYRELERALDRTVERLAERATEVWAARALSSLRRCLAQSAEVQGKLVDEMLSVR